MTGKKDIVNIGQIAYFVSAYEQGSFSAAARVCFVTVQALSKSISSLEQELGHKLFTRGNRNVTPTRFGAAFYEQSVPVLKAFRDLESFPDEYAAALQKTKLSMLLCVTVFPRCRQVLASLSALLSHTLGCVVKMELSRVDDGLLDIEAGRADVAVTIGTVAREGFTCTPIAVMPTGVIVSLSHPLAGRDSVTLRELSDHRVVLSRDFDDFNDFNESVLSIYRKRGLTSPEVRVDTAAEVDDFDRMFMEGKVYVFCASVPAMFRDLDGAALVPISEQDACPVPVCLVSREGEHGWLRDALVETFANPMTLIKKIGG